MLISERGASPKSRDTQPIKIYSPDGSHAQNWATRNDTALNTIGHQPADYYRFGGLGSQSNSNTYNTASPAVPRAASSSAIGHKNLRYLK